jgi:immune inhibitor A
LAATVAASAPAAPPAGTAGQPQGTVLDDLPDATEAKRREMRKVALQEVLEGRASVQNRNGSKVVKFAKSAQADDQYVELAREKTDKIFVVLAEFGNERHPDYPDADTNPSIPGPATFNGPLHNQIPQPDRTKDTKTIWQPDFNRPT